MYFSFLCCWLLIVPLVVFGLFLYWLLFLFLFFDSVFPLSTDFQQSCLLPSTDYWWSCCYPCKGLDRVEGYFKGHTRVCIPNIGNPNRVEGSRDSHAPSCLCWSVVCYVYETLLILTAFFGGSSSFDRPDYLFESFLIVLKMTLSPFFFLVIFLSPLSLHWIAKKNNTCPTILRMTLSLLFFVFYFLVIVLFSHFHALNTKHLMVCRFELFFPLPCIFFQWRILKSVIFHIET
jgi:hypothetical protein